MSPSGKGRVIWITMGVVLAALAVAAAVRLFGLRFPWTGAIPSGGPESEESAGKKTLYYCPMHPTMVSDKPDDCPICTMRMVPREEEEAPAEEAAPPGAIPPSGPKKVIYRSTMHPSEVSDRPGKDSMGMEMVPVEVEEEGPEKPAVEGLAPVRIPTRKQQLIGVRTTLVERAPFVRTLRTVGRVTVDETRLHHVHTKIEGWVERLNVNATGERVEKGRPLLSIYSPELVATQEEFLLALRARREAAEGSLQEMARGAEALVESARRRLLLFDLTEEQIADLERTGEASRTVTLFSPLSGHVLKRNVTHGERINPEMMLLDIADLSRVWVLASIYEYELPFVKVGQAAEMTLSYLPGTTYQGKVGLIYPVLEGATRTAQVRLEFPNPGLELKPEMYADVEIRSDLGERLTVPESAILDSGTRSVVFVDKGEGYFEPREVRVGLRLPEAVEILEGLSEGERVVSSGNFFIDSESKLKAALEAAAAPEPGKAQP